MTVSDEELQRRLVLPRYPLSNRYSARWLTDNNMGPNPLWLAEALAAVMPLRAGTRVLDLGCGTALTSIFLAREFDLQVWAADLWVKPSENLPRIVAQGVADRVFPIYAEAHALPFAEGFFDAAVSYDAYHYFGTDECYLPYYASFVKPGGSIGIVVPGHRDEPESDPAGFHSPQWWRRHWTTSGAVTVDHADMLPHGYEDWALWASLQPRRDGAPGPAGDVAVLADDTSRSLGFTRIAAHRSTTGSGPTG
jgi:cyclopropane fatty-acyl-phospholipid synthase-like methyltransferase